jgi:hypothetical protein
MTGIRLTLALFLTLPSSFSIAQGATQTSPFERYLHGIRAGQPETALMRVAAQCGINLDKAIARFADRPGEEWKVVKSLAKAQDDQETDFFATAAVWHVGQRTLVEVWNMDLEARDEIRTIYCLLGQNVTNGEQIEWSSSNDEETSAPTATSWAYEIRWKVEQGKFFKSTLERFVNDRERPVPTPKLGPDAPAVRRTDPRNEDVERSQAAGCNVEIVFTSWIVLKGHDFSLAGHTRRRCFERARL